MAAFKRADFGTVATVLVPAQQEHCRNDDERNRESDPEAIDTPFEDEAEEEAKRKAENPVTDQVRPHGSARFSKAAQCAGRDGLDAVEDLECCGDPEQAGADCEHARICCVERNERARDDEEDDAGKEHEAGSQREGEPPGAAGACRVLGADCVANADGRCGAYSERDHISKAGVVECDSVRCERDGSEEPGGEGSKVPGADFKKDLPGRRSAEPDELPELEQARARPAGEQRVSPPSFVPPGETNESCGHADAGDDGGDGGPADTKSGKAELAIDQNPVAEPVEQVGEHERDSDDADLSYPLKVPAGRCVEEQRKSAEREDEEIASGRRCHFRRNADVDEYQACGDEQQHERHARDAGEIDTLREPVMAGLVVAAAVGVGDERVEAEDEADAEERWRVVNGVAHGDSADCGGAEPADHDGIDYALKHPAEFAEHNGDGERDHGTQFPSPLGLGGDTSHFSTLAEQIMKALGAICNVLWPAIASRA